MQAVSYNTFCLKRHQLMMEQPLPSFFDVVVVGTGLEESILAAAAARNGHSVLHVDTNDQYGGEWAAYTFDGIQDWIRRQQSLSEPEVLDNEEGEEEEHDPRTLQAKFCEEGEQFMLLKPERKARDVVQKWHVPENDAVDEAATKVPDDDIGREAKKADQKFTKDFLSKNSRKFNLDLLPRLLFSRGSMVELLISSNVSRYTEFKSVSRVLTLLDGSLVHVPSSRADVFQTRAVSVVEKRILMKFLTFCHDLPSMTEEEAGARIAQFKDRKYREFLKHEKLTDNLVHFVMHSIAMVGEDATTQEGLAATAKFLTSLGRFGGATPFLWSMFGAGELPQAFCRLCAVFGGTYFLGRKIEGIVVSEDKTCKAIIAQGSLRFLNLNICDLHKMTGVPHISGTRINCGKLVLPISRSPFDRDVQDEEKYMSRQLILLSDSVMPSEKEQVGLL